MKLIFYLPETDDVEQSVCRLALFLNSDRIFGLNLLIKTSDDGQCGASYPKRPGSVNNIDVRQKVFLLIRITPRK